MCQKRVPFIMATYAPGTSMASSLPKVCVFSASHTHGFCFRDLALRAFLEGSWMKMPMLLFMVSLLPAASVFAADDHGNTLTTATNVSVPSTTGGAIQYAGDSDCFRFTISGVQNVTAITTGATDTFGDLLDAAGALLAFNDDANGSRNFSITRQLTAGTYFLKVRHYSAGASSGPYQLVLSASASVSPPAIRTFGNNSEIANGDMSPSVTDNTDLGQAPYLGAMIDRSFQIRNAGGASLILTGSPAVTLNGALSSAFKVTAQPPSLIAPGSIASFTVRYTPTSTGGGVDSAVISIASNTPSRSVSTFAIQGKRAAIHESAGNTFESALILFMPDNSKVTVPEAINYGGDLDYYRFTLNVPHKLKMRTFRINGSNVDTYGTLFNQARTNIAQDDNGGGAGQFSIEKYLSAGTYYLQVKGAIGAVTGAYTLSVEALP